MTTVSELSVVEHNLTPTTNLAEQLSDPTIVERRIDTGGYYAASGRLSNGDLVEMWIVDERASGCQAYPSCVYLALNGRSNRRRYDLGGDTASLADWLRGYHIASREVFALGSAGRRLLEGLYRDIQPVSESA